MNSQYLEYIRQELITATADLSGMTKGQLVAFAENCQIRTDRFRRQRKRIRDEVTGKIITLYSAPVPGKQDMAKGESIPLIEPVLFCTASWRRAVLALDEHQKSWLLWNYSENIAYEYQVTITRWAWAEFKVQLGAKKIAGKTLERLKMLIWLAAQDVKSEIAGRETYQYQKLAELVGVEQKNWSKTFTKHWEGMRNIFSRLDNTSLCAATKTRSTMKATNYQQTIAKVD